MRDGGHQRIAVVLFDAEEGAALDALASVHGFRNPRPRPGGESPEWLGIALVDAGQSAPRAPAGADVHLRGVYRPTGALPAPEDLRDSRGLMIGITDRDGADPATFDSWYDGEHAREVLDSGIYWSAHRFVRDEGSGHGGYFAYYETERDEPAAFKALLKYPDRGTEWPDWFVVRTVCVFNRVSG